MAEVDELEVSLEELMLSVDRETLYAVTLELGMPAKTCEGRNKMFVMKAIRKHLDDKETEDIEVKVTTMKLIISSIEEEKN